MRRAIVAGILAVALTGGVIAAANVAWAAPGDRTGFCKSSQHYKSDLNSAGRKVQCLPPSGNGTTWEWTDVDVATRTSPMTLSPQPAAPPAKSVTKRPHFTG